MNIYGLTKHVRNPLKFLRYHLGYKFKKKSQTRICPLKWTLNFQKFTPKTGYVEKILKLEFHLQNQIQITHSWPNPGLSRKIYDLNFKIFHPIFLPEKR